MKRAARGSPSRARAIRAAAIASLVIGSATAIACHGKSEVSFQLKVPGSVRDQAAYYEIGAFANGPCPPLAQLSAGIPAGAAARLAFGKDAKNPPGLGDLQRGSYAFAAVAKGQDCAVLAEGCSVVDVGSSSDISITLQASAAPSGACAAGTVCQNAQCVPSSDNNDPSVGAGCSLQLMGAGPLGDPLGLSGTLASSPTITATPQGFLLVYREYDPVAGTARLTFLPIDNGGGAGTPHQETLPDRCAGSEEGDAIGTAFADDKGLTVVARAPCAGRAGFDFYAIDRLGNVQSSGVETGELGGSQLLLSTSHALARAPGAKNFLLAFTKDGQALLDSTADAHFSGQPSVSFGGAPPHSNAWVATSDQLVALLVGATGVPSPPPVGDAGDDSATTDPPPDGDAGGPQPILRLNIAAAGAALQSLAPPLEFAGTWGSISAQGTRLIVASNGTTASEPVAYQVFEVRSPRDPVKVGGFETQHLGKVLYADVVYHQDHMFFAVEQPSSISLVAFDRAGTEPQFLREVSLTDDPRVPSLQAVRDGRVSIAASDTRVAIAWVTGKTLTTNDAVGGYAVFACR